MGWQWAVRQQGGVFYVDIGIGRDGEGWQWFGNLQGVTDKMRERGGARGGPTGGSLASLMLVESHPLHCSSSWRARMALAGRWLVRAVVEFFRPELRELEASSVGRRMLVALVVVLRVRFVQAVGWVVAVLLKSMMEARMWLVEDRVVVSSTRLLPHRAVGRLKTGCNGSMLGLFPDDDPATWLAAAGEVGGGED
eukprot:Em0007g960a